MSRRIGLRGRRQARPTGGGVAEALLELARRGPAPLSARKAPSRTETLSSVAAVVPSFRRGSGGHTTIVRLLGELVELGHDVSLWLEDCEGRHADEDPSVTEASFGEFFDAGPLRLRSNFRSWEGADVVLATGWQTVPRALLLGGARARAYLVQDHEPDFYAASAESIWAAETYRSGMHCIAASPWLADLLRSRYGASASHLDLAVDHSLYRPGPERRAGEHVIFYARAATPRRAVPLGLAALAELARRRPGIEISLFGEGGALDATFAHRNLGVLSEAQLAALFGRATVGIVLSVTNPSLVGLQMMACGLPCVELASESMLASFADGDAPELAAPDPLALAAAFERLLDDPGERARASRAAVQAMEGRTWRVAALQLQEGLAEATAIADRSR